MERAAQLEKEYETLTQSRDNVEEDYSTGNDVSKVLDSYWKSGGVQKEIKVSLAQAGDILSLLTSAVKELRAARSVSYQLETTFSFLKYFYGDTVRKQKLTR